MPAATLPAIDRLFVRPMLWLVDGIAALFLFADLLVVCASVLSRFVFNAPLEWADDVARGLMVALSFFGAAGALARGENVGIAFFVERMSAPTRRLVAAVSALMIAVTTICVTVHALQLGALTEGQTTGSGLPLQLTFYPMGFGALCMVVFALDHVRRLALPDLFRAAAILLAIAGGWYLWAAAAPDTMPPWGMFMLVVFVVGVVAGMPIGFVLALSALVFVWTEGSLPGVIFAQQMARGIDNFVLLAIPFFILVGYLMEANGM